jgi:hypothetical protein
METVPTTTPTLTVWVDIDRPEALRRGFDPSPKQRIVIPIAELTNKQREIIAARLSSTINGKDHLVTLGNTTHRRVSIKIKEPTLSELLKKLEEDEVLYQTILAEKAKRKELIDHTTQKIKELVLAAKPDDLLTKVTAPNEMPYVINDEWRLADWLKPHDLKIDEPDIKIATRKALNDPEVITAFQPTIKIHREFITKRNAEMEKQRTKNEEFAKAKKEKERLKKESWINEHGSSRLRRLVQEKIEYTAVYLDERLAKERPGWRWDDIKGTKDHLPRNPPEIALNLLDEARKIDPKARLVYWTNEIDYNETERGYTCMSEFLNNDIIFKVSNSGSPPIFVENGDD